MYIMDSKSWLQKLTSYSHTENCNPVAFVLVSMVLGSESKTREKGGRDIRYEAHDAQRRRCLYVACKSDRRTRVRINHVVRERWPFLF